MVFCFLAPWNRAMPFDSKCVANYFLQLAEKNGERLSPMRLIKLVYIAHGWHLGLLDKPLINERPEAWKYGPVVPSLYHEFKKFGNEPIASPATYYDPESGRLVPHAPPSDEAARSFMNRIWEVYRSFSAIQLSSMTHKPGTPWYITWHDQGGKDFQGTDIPQDLIRDHYKPAARQAT